jgi:hypothetical protein
MRVKQCGWITLIIIGVVLWLLLQCLH